MKTSTIALSSDSKEKLNDLKKKYSFKTDDETVNKICDYFIFNKIHPKNLEDLKANKSLLEEVKLHIDKRHKWITDNDITLRKFIGGNRTEIEKVVRDLGEIKALLIDNNLQIEHKNYKDDNDVFTEKEVIETVVEDNFSSEALEKLEEDYRELLTKYKALTSFKERLKNNYKYESIGMMGKKQIIVNIPVDEWENILK